MTGIAACCSIPQPIDDELGARDEQDRPGQAGFEDQIGQVSGQPPGVGNCVGRTIGIHPPVRDRDAPKVRDQRRTIQQSGMRPPPSTCPRFPSARAPKRSAHRWPRPTRCHPSPAATPGPAPSAARAHSVAGARRPAGERRPGPAPAGVWPAAHRAHRHAPGHVARAGRVGRIGTALPGRRPGCRTSSSASAGVGRAGPESPDSRPTRRCSATSCSTAATTVRMARSASSKPNRAAHSSGITTLLPPARTTARACSARRGRHPVTVRAAGDRIAQRVHKVEARRGLRVGQTLTPAQVPNSFTLKRDDDSRSVLLRYQSSA